MINPHPSLIRALAHDAASARARRAGRSVWDADDAQTAADTFHRLVRACYTLPGDGELDCYLRFQQAERAEKGG